MSGSVGGVPWLWPAVLSISVLYFGWHAFVVWRALDAEEWPRVSGSVLQSRTEGDTEGARWAEVSYRFEVDGKEYRGTRVRFHGLRRGELMAGWTTDDYRPGRTVLVAYNPRSPRDSVLEPGVSTELWVSCVGSLAVVGVSLYQVAGAATA